MPASKSERVASGCLLGCLFVLCGGTALVILLAAIFGTSDRDRPFALGIFLPASLFILAVPIGTLALQRVGKTRRSVVEFLGGIARATGGTVELPSLWMAAAASRVDCTVGGHPVEIRILRQHHRAGSYVIATALESEHAKLGARLYLPTARVHVHLRRPMPLRLVFATRSRLGAMGASLVGATEIRTGDGWFDERFVIVTDRPDEMGARIREDAAFRDGLAALVQQNPPYATSVTVAPDGVYWLGLWSADLSSEKVAHVVSQLGALAETLAPEART